MIYLANYTHAGLDLFWCGDNHLWSGYVEDNYPDSKLHGTNMGPIWDQQNPGGPHVGPVNFAICVTTQIEN